MLMLPNVSPIFFTLLGVALHLRNAVIHLPDHGDGVAVLRTVAIRGMMHVPDANNNNAIHDILISYFTHFPNFQAFSEGLESCRVVP